MAIAIQKHTFTLFSKIVHYLNQSGKRGLFCESHLMLDRFLRQRIFKKDKLGIEGKDSLLKKLNDIKTPLEAKNSVFELDDLIHVSESKEDILVMESTFKLLCKCDTTSIDYFNSGANLIRLYHYLGLPLEAYQLYKDDVCHSLLKGNACHKILMDLLYKHRKYEEVVNVFEGTEKFNHDCVTLVLAALYHINTDKSYLKAQNVISKHMDNNKLSRRSLYFFSMLSINQNNPKQAMKTLNKCSENSLTLNIKLMSLAKLGNVTSVKDILIHIKTDSDHLLAPFKWRLYHDTVSEMKEIESLFKENPNEFISLQQDLSDRAVLSNQTVQVLLEKVIPSEISQRQQSGKVKVFRHSLS